MAGKQFEDFLATLTPEVQYDIQKANASRVSQVDENIETAVSEMLYAISLSTSLELLRLYHQWLDE